MSKTICILTGSPRKKGNSDMLAQAFAKGAESAGHRVVCFDCSEHTVSPCIACDTCWSTGKACTFDDGFDRLAPLLQEADVLALCSPLYWYTFSAQIKSGLDKMYSFMVPACPRPLRIRESVLLMTAAEDRSEAFAGPVESYRAVVKFLQWQDRGMVLATGVHAKGEIADTGFLSRAEELGRRL